MAVEVSHAGDRDLNLDFVKGVLVVVMVVYHAMNYFADVDPDYYGYIRFINAHSSSLPDTSFRLYLTTSTVRMRRSCFSV